MAWIETDDRGIKIVNLDQVACIYLFDNENNKEIVLYADWDSGCAALASITYEQDPAAAIRVANRVALNIAGLARGNAIITRQTVDKIVAEATGVEAQKAD